MENIEKADDKAARSIIDALAHLPPGDQILAGLLGSKISDLIGDFAIGLPSNFPHERRRKIIDAAMAAHNMAYDAAEREALGIS